MGAHMYKYTSTQASEQQQQKDDEYRVAQFINNRQQKNVFILAIQNTCHIACGFIYTKVLVSAARKSI